MGSALALRRFLLPRCLVAALLTCLAAFGAAQTAADERAVQAYKALLARTSAPRLAADLRQLAAFGSRLAGSEGERALLEWTESEFRRLGFENIRREEFHVTVPDPAASGTLSGRGFTAAVLPLWPNLVRTSTCDVSGPLLYGKRGSLEDLSGKQVEGRIVLLEFDSGSNWRSVFKLGGKAVVFIEPEGMHRVEAEQKFSSVPIEAPRFYLPLKAAGPVLAAAFRGESARLKCRQDWVKRKSYNLLADLPGTDPSLRAERVVLSAPADSMSVVPAQAPGASGASSVASLLELARQAKSDPGPRPMTFAVVSSSSLALQGWREYANRRIEEGRAAFLHLTLDLNDGSDVLGAFGRGWFHEYRNESLDPVRSLTRSLRSHADRLAPLLAKSSGRFVMLDSTNDSDGKTWRNTIYSRFAFGCEPLTMAGMNAVTFATVENARERIDTPFDTLARFSFERLHRQVQALSCLLWHVVRDTSDRSELSPHKVPVEVRIPRRQSLTGGFSIIEGQVARFDPNRSFIADIPVPDALAVASHSSKTLAGVRGPMIQYVDPENARYRFLGIPPSSAYFHLEPRLTTLSAFALDKETGRIRIGPTEALLGHPYETSFRLVSSYRSLPIVAFPCAAISLFGLVDPQELTPLYTYRVLEPKADAAPRNYSMALPSYDPKFYSDYEDCAVLFLEPETRFKLLMGTSAGEWRLILTGAARENPGGAGVGAEDGPLQNISLRTAKDISTLNGSRLDAFRKYRILSPELSRMQDDAEAAIEEADKARERMDWTSFERESRAAWALSLRAHPMIQGTVNDVVNGVLFYLALLIPFSYFVERLLFARRSLTTQLFATIGIFVGAFLLLRAIHPAFEIVSNPSMIFVAFVMGSLSVLVGTFIVGKFEASLRDIRAKRTGLGHIDVGRMSVAMAAFNLGIANMRRRRARTFLTTLTLVVMTFIVLSFTSIVPGISIAEAPSGHDPAYPGILVRGPGLEPLQSAAQRAVSNEFAGRARIVRRAWYYGAEITESGVLSLASGGRTVDVRAAVGFEPGEIETTSLGPALLPGGRWIRPGDFDVALLPFSIAERLGIGAQDVGRAQISLGGRPLRVIGILSDSGLRGAVDLDGEPILPADFALSKRYQTESRSTNQAFRKFLRLDPGVVLVTSLGFAQSLGGEVRSVAVRFDDPGETRRALESLMPRLRMNLYAAVPESGGLQVRQFSVLQASKNAGLGLVLVQMLISAVFVLNTMVASVFERKREIGIFSSIGLAPNHIAVLFFAESCVYGVLGAVIGYYLAQGVARGLIQTGLVPGLYLNFSATSAVLAAGIVLAVVLLSTIYPARVASRLAAPAYESEVESKPEGDLWTMLLPFRVGADEAEPLIQFFSEWLSGHEEHAVGDFVTAGTRVEGNAVESTLWLAPFDLGVSQHIRVVAEPGPGGAVELMLTLRRLGGEPENWVNLNRRFLTSMRRQFLAWRTRPKIERKELEPA